MLTRTVVLHGYLSKFHEGPIRIVANTIAEAVEAVTRQLPGFKPHPVQGRHRIKIVGCETKETLHQALGDQLEIHIVPQLSGGKNGGLMQVLVGAALVGLGFFMGAGTLLGSMMMKIGALSLLGGLAQILAPQPETDKDEATKSRYLGSPKNTVQIGTRIPILYGTHQAFGHYLAFDINAIQVQGNGKDTGGESSK